MRTDIGVIWLLNVQLSGKRCLALFRSNCSYLEESVIQRFHLPEKGQSREGLK